MRHTNIKLYDAGLQTILVCILFPLSGWLLYTHLSYLVLFSIFLLKVYQIIGGGGVHLWACHGLGKKSLNPFFKTIILMVWMLVGIGRASHFCKYHILHHHLYDKEGDPHSPNDFNVVVLTLGLWTLFTQDKDKHITPKIASCIEKSHDRIRSSCIANFFDKYHYSLITFVISLSLYLSPTFALYVIILPMLLNILDGNFFFVYYFHKKGEVQNMPWASYWIAAAGNHRGHHKWLR